MPTRDTAWPQGTPCWVDCQVDDTTAARAFYGELFGWDIQDGPDEFGGYLMAMKDGRAAAGIGPKPQGGPAMPSVWTTYLAADSADATAAKVAEAGGTAMMPPFDVGPVGRMFVATDPTGGVFGVWEAKEHIGAGVFNEDGAYCWNELHTVDYDAARVFYGQVFGHVFTEIGDGENFAYSTFALGDGGPEAAVGGLADETTMPGGSPMSYWLTWFQVAAADAASAKAVELGASVMMGPDDSAFGRMTVLTGPQGEVFGLIDPTTTVAVEDVVVDGSTSA